MRICTLDHVRPRMRLARTIYSPDGKILLSAGVAMHPSYVGKLREIGHTSVYIADGMFDDIQVPQVVKDSTRVETITAVREVMTKLPVGGKATLTRAVKAVESMVDEILTSREMLVGLVDLKTLDNYTYAHSVNVGILTLMIARGLGYSRGEMVDLGVGAILHDVGKCQVEQAILLKPEQLTPSELEQVKRHTQYGFDTLREEFKVNLLSAHIAYQHHERLDGSGYPRGLKGADIIDWAKIVSVADVYDAITSDRVYRRRLPPSEGIRLLQVEAAGRLDARMVRKLTDYLVPFPIASVVRLSTGETALVISVNPKDFYRPQVKVIKDERGRSLSTQGPVVDLAQELDVSIVKTVDL